MMGTATRGWGVVVCLLWASAASARESLAAFPLDVLNSAKAPVDPATKANVASLFPVIARSVASGPSSSQLARAVSESGQKDCGRKDECLARFAKLAGARYGFYAVLIVDSDGSLSASGRVVRNDGQLMLGPKVGAKMSVTTDGFATAALEAIRSLIAELGIAGITDVSSMGGVTCEPKTAHSAMVQTLDEIGREAIASGGWRLAYFLNVEPAIAAAIENATTQQGCEELFGWLNTVHAGVHWSPDAPVFEGHHSQPEIATYPIDVSRLPKTLPAKEVAETSRLLSHFVRVAVRGVTSAQIAKAQKGIGHADCGVKDDCLAGFAEATGAMYALHVSLVIDGEKMVTAQGRVVRRDGRLMAGPRTSDKFRVDTGLATPASAAFLSLIRELGLGGLSSIRPGAARFEEIGHEPSEAWRKLRARELDELGGIVAGRGLRSIDVYAKTEPRLSVAIDHAVSRDDSLNVALRLRALRSELGEAADVECNIVEHWKEHRLEDLEALLASGIKQHTKPEAWVANRKAGLTKMVQDAAGVADCHAVMEEFALTEVELEAP